MGDSEGADLRDPVAAEAAFQRAHSALGGVDVLINLAGAFEWAPLSPQGLGVWLSLFEANLRTCANMCAAAVAGLSDGGAIVNIGAAAAEHSGAGMGAYAASKAGVARLTESLAAELRGRIRVNAILPLTLDTPQNRRDMPDVDPASWTNPAAIADIVLFLASDASRAINGALIQATAATSH
jgi:NAD(P)-dependent dehydrogenase (short-subunit alcohol dehydrogenase family)